MRIFSAPHQQPGRSLRLGCLFFSLAVHAALAQTAPAKVQPAEASDSDSTYVLKVNSNLVVLDIVVNDKKGNPISGLNKNDFKVYEDNIEQDILSFDFTDARNASATRSKPIHSTADLDKREPNAPVSIIVIDEVTTRFEERYLTRYSLEKYLAHEREELSQPTTLITRTMDHMSVLSDYTTSKKDLLAALDRHLSGNNWLLDHPNYYSDMILANLASLMEIAKATQGHPGHKNVVWIGHGLIGMDTTKITHDDELAIEQALAKCSELLRSARITLYGVDPSGASGISGMNLTEDGSIDLNDPFQGHLNFNTLVMSTGGRSLRGRNDIDHLIDASVRNGEVFYTLTYRPAQVSDKNMMKFRKIRVVPNDPDYAAITRTGYFVLPVEAIQLAEKNSSKKDQSIDQVLAKLQKQSFNMEDFDLVAASNNLMVFDGIPLEIQRDLSNTELYHIAFPANRLGLYPEGNKDVGKIKLVVLDYVRTGKLLSKQGKVLTIQLDSAAPGATDNRKVVIHAPIKIAENTARVRMIVRSDNSGYIGADNIYLVDKNTLNDPLTGLKSVAHSKK